MVKFPMKFDVEASSSKEVNKTWDAKAQDLPPIVSAIPPEFGGPGGGYSPEDLFALAVVNCIIATFKVYAEKGGLSFASVTGKASLTVDRFPSNGSFGMTQIDIFLDIKTPSDGEKAKKTMDQAIKDCAVSNSIKTGKTFHINLS